MALSMEPFTYLYGIALAIAGFYLIFMALWLGKFRGGFGLSDADTLFNWHPLLMTIGMIFLYGNAILVYRAFRKNKKKKLKIAHAVITLTGFGVAVCGVKTVFTTHELKNPPVPHMYSLHSWIGLTSVTLMACQWLCGMVIFLYPGLLLRHREIYCPIHLFFGISTFIAAIVTVETGLIEKAFFAIDNITDLPYEGVLVNAIGVLILSFGCLVVYLATNVKFKRLPLPEDEMLLTPTEMAAKKN